MRRRVGPRAPAWTGPARWTDSVSSKPTHCSADPHDARHVRPKGDDGRRCRAGPADTSSPCDSIVVFIVLVGPHFNTVFVSILIMIFKRKQVYFLSSCGGTPWIKVLDLDLKKILVIISYFYLCIHTHWEKKNRKNGYNNNSWRDKRKLELLVDSPSSWRPIGADPIVIDATKSLKHPEKIHRG